GHPGRVPLRLEGRTAQPVRHRGRLPVCRDVLPADRARALRDAARRAPGPVAARGVRRDPGRTGPGEGDQDWRSRTGVVPARQDGGPRGRDEAARAAHDRRQEGVPDRHPDPLGIRRHQHWPVLVGQRADPVRGRRQQPYAGVQSLPGQPRENMTDRADAAHPWSTHRRRAQQLRERYPPAAEVLTLFDALLDVWAPAWTLAEVQRPRPDGLADWALESTLAGVVKVTESAGPAVLASSVQQLANDQPRDLL